MKLPPIAGREHCHKAFFVPCGAYPRTLGSMTKIRAAITAVGGYVPDEVVTNADLAKIVDTNDEWIVSRTGIKERRVLREEGKGVSDLIVPAVEEIIKKRGLDPEEIDLIICGTITGDMIFPDTATTVAYRVGATNAFGFDLNAACSGFLYSLTTGVQFIESGNYKKVIVVGADKMSAIVDYTDRTTCILFGDGAGAVLLEPATDDNGIIDSVMGGDGSGRDFLRMKAGGSLYPPTIETVTAREHFVYQEGRSVFKAAVKGMNGSVSEVLQRNGLKTDDIDWVVPHQANMRIITSLADFLDIPLERVMINIDKYGNTTAATLPLCLWEWEDQLKKGDQLILTAFGGGFTWGSIYLKWAYDGASAHRD